MVSPLSSRFFAGTSTSSTTSTKVVDCPSRGNASISEDNLNRSGYKNESLQSFQQHTKRTFAGTMKTSSLNAHNDNSESGYSADRDSVSNVHHNPPVGSINYPHSNSISIYMTRNNFKCPKRRKLNERQFAATNVKADLARAGIPFKQQQQNDTEMETSTNNVHGNNVDIINLNKNHVQLVHSGDYVSDSLFQSSSSMFIDRKTLSSDYTGMINAVREFHPLNVGGRSRRGINININSSSKISSSAAAAAAAAAQQSNKDTWSAPSTSSDVSDPDTESDSGSGTGSSGNDHRNNNHAISFSPLLEDFLDSSKVREAAKKNKTTRRAAATTTIEPRNMLSTLSNAITMSEILQLSNTARIVTNSSAPFSIVHANAAFQRLLGKRATDDVTGTSFISLLDTKSNPFEDELSLAAFMSSSSSSRSRGVGDQKLYLLRPKTSSNETASQEPMKCTIRVSPVLAQKTEMKEATTIGYFAIEFVSDSNQFQFSSLFGSNKMNAPMGVVA